MSGPDAYSHVVRQAAHDATRAVLAAPPGSVEGSVALRAVVAWLADAHGPAAVCDLAEELAVDLAGAALACGLPRRSPRSPRWSRASRWPPPTRGSTTPRRRVDRAPAPSGRLGGGGWSA